MHLQDIIKRNVCKFKNFGWGFGWKQSKALVLCLYDSRKSNLSLFRIFYL